MNTTLTFGAIVALASLSLIRFCPSGGQFNAGIIDNNYKSYHFLLSPPLGASSHSRSASGDKWHYCR